MDRQKVFAQSLDQASQLSDLGGSEVRIALVSSADSDPNAGVAGVQSELALEFRVLGHDVTSVFRDTITPELKGVAAQAAFPLAILRHRDYLSNDVLDINAGDGWALGSFVRLTARARRPLLVARSHGLEHTAHEMRVAAARNGELSLSWKYPIWHGGIRLWEVSQYLRRADVALFLNEDDRKYAINRLQVHPTRARIVRNGLPSCLIGLPFPPMHTQPPRLGIALLGGFSLRKGIDYAIPALSELLSNNEGLHVGFLGTGVASNLVLSRFDTSLHDRITNVPYYNRCDLPSLLARFHVLLFPSLREGFGLSVIEAMACGLAPVVTDIPGVANVLSHEKDVILVPARSVNGIVRAVQRLLSDGSQLSSLRRAAYVRAQDFSWSDIASGTISIYHEYIERQGLGRHP